MKQIDKDRIARIDAEIERYQEMFKIRYALESAPDYKREAFDAHHNSASIQRKVQELLEKREKLLNRAIFGSMKKSAWERKVEERRFNYEAAMEEQQYYIDEIADALRRGDEIELNTLRRKLNEANRLSAIYKKSLTFILDKKQTVQFTSEYKQLDVNTEKEVASAMRPPDQEILDIISGKIKRIETATSLDMLAVPEGYVEDNSETYTGTGQLVSNEPEEFIEVNPFELTENHKKVVI